MPETQPLARSFRHAIREFRIASKSKRENTMNAKDSLIASCSAIAMLAMCMHANAQAPAPVTATQPVPAKPSASSNEIFFETDPASWARVTRVVEPFYPEDALAAKAGARVEIEVLLDIVGGVKEVRELKSDSKFPSFEKAIRDVLPKWAFQSPITDRCFPVEAVGSVIVQFETREEDGKTKGVISLFHRSQAEPQSAAARRGPGPKMLNRSKLTEVLQGAYPRDARRFGGQANVYALITIDPKTGVPIEVESTFVVAPDSFKRMFSTAAENSLRTARFSEFPGRTTPWQQCFTVGFRLEGQPR
jgi:hypothetical protein